MIHNVYTYVYIQTSTCVREVGEEFQPAQLVRARGILITLGMGVQIPVMDMTFSSASIHSPTVNNLQRCQRPVPPIPCLYGKGG